MTELWFAIQVVPRHELTTAAILRGKGYQEFVPMYRRHRRWSDRTKVISFPLFQGYIFCRFDTGVKAPIVTTPGVIRIVGTSKGPLPIDEKEISAIQRVNEAGSIAQPHLYVRSGTKVLIADGPLAGIEGTVTDIKNRCVILSIHLVQKSISVDIGSCSLTVLGAVTPSQRLDPTSLPRGAHG
jgi:transcription antitermination factor NusG